MVVVRVAVGRRVRAPEAVGDPRRQRVIYISPTHKLSRAKAAEYNLSDEGDQILKEIEGKLAGLMKGDRKTLPCQGRSGRLQCRLTGWFRVKS